MKACGATLRYWIQSQKVRFLLIGGLNTMVGYGIFSGLYLMLNPRLGHIPIICLSHVLAVTFSFWTHRSWVFVGGNANNLLQQWLRHQASYLALLGLSLMLTELMLWALGWHLLLIQLAVTFIVVIASYLLNTRFVFAQRRRPPK